MSQSLSSILGKTKAYLNSKQVHEYLNKRVTVRAGVDLRVAVFHDIGETAVLDHLVDELVVRFAATKVQVAQQVVRDLIVVEAIMEAFRALWMEPEWSPYP